MKSGLMLLATVLVGANAVMATELQVIGQNSAPAAQKEAAQKEVTLTGEGGCELCQFGAGKTCEMALRVKEGNTTVIYNLAHNTIVNKAVKAFGGVQGGKLCMHCEPINVTGTVTETGGKKILTVTKIEKAAAGQKKNS